VLLLSFPGINVVSGADFAGEMGPITDYANPKSITGRAGLRPSRYQSDQVAKANGPLVRNGNRALRAAILGIADNLIVCNHYFQVRAARTAMARVNAAIVAELRRPSRVKSATGVPPLAFITRKTKAPASATGVKGRTKP
jgi:transposase